MISRHIVIELIKASFISVSALTLLLLYGNLSRYEDVLIKAFEQNSSEFLKLCALLLPYALSMSIPFGFTVALALVVGNWASNREIIALSSLGVSPKSLFWPVCLFSTFLSSLTIVATLQWGPQNRDKFDKLRDKIWFVAPFVSSFIGSLIDTIIFFFIAFYNTDVSWISLAFGDFSIKILMSLIMLIPFRMLLNKINDITTEGQRVTSI